MILDYRFGHIAEDGRRRRAWIASLSPLFDAMVETETIVPDTAFHRYQHLGEMVLATCRIPPQAIERTAGRVTAQGLDHLVLRTQVNGRVRVSVDGVHVDAGPGDLLVLDLSRPVRIEMDAQEGVGLVVPWRAMGRHAVDRSGWHGRVLDGSTHPMAHMLADHLRHLGRCVASAKPPQLHHLSAATIAVCKAMFLAEGTGAEPDPLDVRAVAAGVAIRRFIDEHLVDVDVPTLTARFGLSRTSLYRLFGKDGGVCVYIRDRRLANAMRRLEQSADRRPKVARLAHECGFGNDLVFSRAFRRKYGINPSDVVPGHTVPQSSWPDAPLLGWLREL